jgi:hypothetical protein
MEKVAYVSVLVSAKIRPSTSTPILGLDILAACGTRDRAFVKRGKTVSASLRRYGTEPTR